MRNKRVMSDETGETDKTSGTSEAGGRGEKAGKIGKAGIGRRVGRVGQEEVVKGNRLLGMKLQPHSYSFPIKK